MPSQKAFTSGSTFPALTPGVLRLYSLLHCPYAQRARLVLEHKSIEYETININLHDKPEWYLRDINPLGMVPSLQKDENIIYESAIVCDYLDEIYPDNKLTPESPVQKAKDNMLRERFGQVTKQYYTGLGTSFLGSEILKCSIKNINDLLSALDVFNKELSVRNTPFFGGDKPMMIDFMIWPHMERIRVFEHGNQKIKLTSDRFEHLLAWIQTMRVVPAVKKTMTSEDNYLNMINREGKFDMNLGLKE